MCNIFWLFWMSSVQSRTFLKTWLSFICKSTFPRWTFTVLSFCPLFPDSVLPWLCLNLTDMISLCIVFFAYYECQPLKCEQSLELWWLALVSFFFLLIIQSSWKFMYLKVFVKHNFAFIRKEMNEVWWTWSKQVQNSQDLDILDNHHGRSGNH